MGNLYAIGHDELKDRPTAKVGDPFDCTLCNGQHELRASERILPDGSREPSDLLLFYECDDKAYLAAIDGRLLP